MIHCRCIVDYQRITVAFLPYDLKVLCKPWWFWWMKRNAKTTKPIRTTNTGWNLNDGDLTFGRPRHRNLEEWWVYHWTNMLIVIIFGKHILFENNLDIPTVSIVRIIVKIYLIFFMACELQHCWANRFPKLPGGSRSHIVFFRQRNSLHIHIVECPGRCSLRSLMILKPWYCASRYLIDGQMDSDR